MTHRPQAAPCNVSALGLDAHRESGGDLGRDRPEDHLSGLYRKIQDIPAMGEAMAPTLDRMQER
jgi:hypothetical protein